MVDLPAAPATRLRPPSWRDPRLLVGVLIVLLSVLLGAMVVGRADDTRPAYAATHPLVPGAALTTDDLRVVHVRLGDGGERYLAAGAGLPADRVVLRTVLPGELVPVSAVGRRDQVDVQPVGVPVAAEQAEPLVPGTLVDVWVAARDRSQAQEAYEQPRRVAQAAQVGRTLRRASGLAGTSTATVQVLLTQDLIPDVLGAISNGARISLVAVPGSSPAATG